MKCVVTCEHEHEHKVTEILPPIAYAERDYPFSIYRTFGCLCSTMKFIVFSLDLSNKTRSYGDCLTKYCGAKQYAFI